MKDPIVEEVRKYRMEHTRCFGGNLHRICEDIRKTEKTLKDRLVKRTPRKLSDQRELLCVAEDGAEYKTNIE